MDTTTIHRRYLAATLDTAAVREETLKGDLHIVVPVVSLKGDMVISARGASDPEFVPRAAIKASLAEWNGRPVVPDHPQRSANDPATADAMVFGEIFSTSFDGDLHHEAWLNTRRASELGGLPQQVVDNARAGTPTEVSVGVTVTLDDVAGVIDGQRYAGVWRDITPDHLAIMPHATGACSMEDGCGMRTAKGTESPLRPLIRQLQLSQEAAHGQLWEALFTTVPALLWIEQTFDDHIVYVTETVNWDLKFWQQTYTITDDVIQLTGDPIAVTPSTTDTTFVALRTNKPPKEETPMCTPAERAATIQGLVDSDATQFTADDIPTLEGLAPDMLAKFTPAESVAPPEVVAPVAPVETVAPVAEVAATPTTPPNMVTMPEADYEAMMGVIADHKNQLVTDTAAVVAQLRAAGTSLTDPELQSLPLATLRTLASDMSTVAAAQPRQVNFAAGAEGRQASITPVAPVAPAPRSYDLALNKVVN